MSQLQGPENSVYYMTYRKFIVSRGYSAYSFQDAGEWFPAGTPVYWVWNNSVFGDGSWEQRGEVFTQLYYHPDIGVGTDYFYARSVLVETYNQWKMYQAPIYPVGYFCVGSYQVATDCGDSAKFFWSLDEANSYIGYVPDENGDGNGKVGNASGLILVAVIVTILVLVVLSG